MFLFDMVIQSSNDPMKQSSSFLFLPGMDTFFASFESMGVASGSCSGSNQSLVCSEVVTTGGQACQAAARFLKTKNTIRKLQFHCNLFTDQGEPCDVKDTWQGSYVIRCVFYHTLGHFCRML